MKPDPGVRLMTVFSMCTLCCVLQGCGRADHWERTLAGPFVGEPCKAEPVTHAVSSLRLTPELSLKVCFEKSLENPVLCLDQVNGTSVWRYVLTPRFEGQERARGQIKELILTEVERVEDGYKVFFKCDWTGGGKERGIIYLKPDFGFRSFALGW